VSKGEIFKIDAGIGDRYLAQLLKLCQEIISTALTQQRWPLVTLVALVAVA